MAGNKRKKENRSKKNLPMIIFAVVSVVILLVLIGSYVLITHYYNKMNKVERQSVYYIADTTCEFTEDVSGEVTEESREETPEKELDEYKQAALEAASNLGIDELQSEDVYNILLVGSDTRDPNDGGRSDTMMLVSINNSTQRIVATSFLRDLYVYLPHKETWDKLNASYAYGGINLLLDTLEYNFSIKIDQFVMVDFQSFVKVVDIIGGIDVDVQEDELYWCNQYIHASNLLLGEEEHSDYLEKADGSFQHLSGKQVLAYSRFRYVGNADFSRTERQRKVINIIFDKLKTCGAKTLLNLLDEFLPEVTTNIEQKEFMELISILPEMSKYEIISWGVPDQGFKYITVDGQSHIGIDFAYYIKKIYGLIYTDRTMESYMEETAAN